MINCCRQSSYSPFTRVRIQKDQCLQDAVIVSLVLAAIFTLGAILASIASYYHISVPFSFLDPSGLHPVLEIAIAGAAATAVFAIMALIVKGCNSERDTRVGVLPEK